MQITDLVYKSPTFLRNAFINAYGYKLYRLRFNKHFWNFYNTLIEDLVVDQNEMQALYFSNLKNALIYASGIKYYNKLFSKVNFFPHEFNELGQLQEIPILTKETIRKNFSEFIFDQDKKKRNVLEHTTSGTTGEKFKFLIPKELLYAENAAFIYRQYNLMGIKPFDKRVTIGGRIFTKKPPFWVFNKYENQLLLSTHHLTPSSISGYIDQIQKFNPVFIQGHPTAILYISEFLLKQNIELKIGLRGIFTTGETLDEVDRKKIELAFNTIVLQQYGSGESIISAFESPEKLGYYADVERGFIELLTENSETNTFKIIGTSFLNPCMPFIRYDMGDLAEKVKTPKTSNTIGLPLVFKNILGRDDDYLVNNYGNMVLPVTIRMAVKPYLTLSTNYQLIQIDNYTFNLKLVDKQKRIKKLELVRKIKDILGPKTQINVQYVEKIISEGGKCRNVINKINN